MSTQIKLLLLLLLVVVLLLYISRQWVQKYIKAKLQLTKRNDGETVKTE